MTPPKFAPEKKIIEMACSVCYGLGYVKRVTHFDPVNYTIDLKVCNICHGEGKFQSNFEILQINGDNFKKIQQQKGIYNEIRTVS